MGGPLGKYSTQRARGGHAPPRAPSKANTLLLLGNVGLLRFFGKGSGKAGGLTPIYRANTRQDVKPERASEHDQR